MTESLLDPHRAAGGDRRVLAFLYLPLIILVVYAFNPSRLQAWPPTGFTLHWFARGGREPQHAGRRSSTRCSPASGRRASRWCSARSPRWPSIASSFFGRETISFLFVLPIALPGVVTGIALRTTFQTAGIDFGLFTIIVGHATFCVVIAYNNVIARLRRLPRTPEEASADLGADTWTTFRRVTLPRHGDRAAVRRPAGLRAELRRDHRHELHRGAGDRDDPDVDLRRHPAPAELPVVNVVAFVLILVSTIPVYLAQRISDGAGGALARA